MRSIIKRFFNKYIFKENRSYSTFFKNLHVVSETNGLKLSKEIKEDYKIPIERPSNHPEGKLIENSFYQVNIWIPELAYNSSHVCKYTPEKTCIQIFDNTVSIPKELIEKYDIREGDYIQIEILHPVSIEDTDKYDYLYFKEDIPSREELKNKLNIKLVKNNEQEIKKREYENTTIKNVENESVKLVIDTCLDYNFDKIEFITYCTEDKKGSFYEKYIINDDEKEVKLPYYENGIAVKFYKGRSCLKINYDKVSLLEKI